MNLRNFAWTAAGTILLVLGIAGLLLPLLPGTVFLIAASACFLRGSQRLHHWLHNHRLLGSHLRAVTQGTGMPLRAKIVTIAGMWLALGISLSRISVPLWAMVILLLLGLIGTAVIARPQLFRRSPRTSE